MNNLLNKFDDEADINLQQDKYLTFVLENRTFAFPIKSVNEIIQIQEATPVPEFPEYVKGIINTKGKVIPIIDLRMRFRLNEAEYNERTCIIIMNITNITIGFIVDTVNSVLNLTQDMMAPSPTISEGTVSKYISSVAKYNNDLIIILDGDKIISKQALNMLTDND